MTRTMFFIVPKGDGWGVEQGGDSAGPYETREAAFETGNLAPSIVPFDPEESFLYSLTVRDPEDADLMPPANAGEPNAKPSPAPTRHPCP